MPTIEQIKKARKEAGLTQKEAAELLGVAHITWRQYESGARNMPKINYELFCIKAGLK